jgi:hypothetical protein
MGFGGISFQPKWKEFYLATKIPLVAGLFASLESLRNDVKWIKL